MGDVQDKINWHEAFYEALQLELKEYKDSLHFESEHQLSKEALRMDVLIIKKEKDTEIKKNLGQIFRTHNVFEYKSEEDYISIDDFYKVYGYALLYKSFEKVDLADITITFAEMRHPTKLMKHLETERGFKVTKAFDGIYYVEGDLFPIQIIEGKSLSEEDNLWLKNLRSNLTTGDMLKVLKKCQEQGDMTLNNAYIFSLIEANTETLKEVTNMSVAEVYDILNEAAEKHGLFKKVAEKAAAEATKKAEEATKKANEDATIEMVKEMLLDKEPVEKIAKWTKFPIAKINELQKQM